MTNDKQLARVISDKRAELEDMLGQRDLLNLKIMQLETDLKNLRTMVFRNVLQAEGNRLTAVGITDAIRTIMRRHGKPMSAADAKMALSVLGFDLARFKNPAAAIHNTMARMAMAGELTYNQTTKQYAMPNRNAAFYGDVPNPLGRNLSEMLREPNKK